MVVVEQRFSWKTRFFFVRGVRSVDLLLDPDTGGFFRRFFRPIWSVVHSSDLTSGHGSCKNLAILQ